MQLDSPARTRFQALIARPDLPLDEAALAIAAEEYAGLDERAYLARLDELAAEVHRQVPAPYRSANTLKALREVLFGEGGLRGNEKAYYDPRNSYLNEVLDRRLGIPISLSLIFMEVARRVGLDLQGVGFPGHFLVKLRPENMPDVFIDPYNGGELLTAEECVARFKSLAQGRDFDPRFLEGVTPRQVLARLLHNLKRIYVEQADDVRAFWVIDRLLLLTPGDLDEIRDRGLVSARLGLKPAAARDLALYLERQPTAADAAELRELLATLRSRPAMLN
ncbi:MAG: transglutaminase family protein [Anaeromyxobacter sp.]|nr:transglutaminase family protein [Anaeromyxobacter sp.]MBL0276024.1 transglutaminase family protein [Anaeromyxobacter sp.]